jgi:RimJ/RimL family protein N-acetyltransferase
VGETIGGTGIRLRRADAGDVPFLVALFESGDVEPFLSVTRARDAGALAEEVHRSLSEPDRTGRLVIEVDAGAWIRTGACGYDVANERSRIARLGGLALDPRFRGRGVSDEAARLLQRYLLFERGFHRLELECYAFNERAIRHAERAGFVREGVKRRAYWRHGDWVDGVLFGLVREDLDDRF